MKLSEKCIESLNFQLEDLHLDTNSQFICNNFDRYLTNENIPSNKLKFHPLLGILLSKLRFYDDSVQLISNNSTLEEIFVATGVFRPYFTVDVEFIYYRLLFHLCSSLQSERLKLYNAGLESRITKVGNRGKLLFQLEKICNILNLVFENNEIATLNECEIMNKIACHIEEVLNSLPSSSIVVNPLPIFNSTPILTENQLQVFNKIQELFYKDFLCRRKMLLKRLDVTIKSFLWGEKAQGKEHEIYVAIQAQRKYLNEEPTTYSLEDVINAPCSLIFESSKKVTESKGNKKSLVKTVIIGSVPDRGGRANEMRPKSEISSQNFKSNSHNQKSFQSKSNFRQSNDKASNKRGRY